MTVDSRALTVEAPQFLGSALYGTAWSALACDKVVETTDGENAERDASWTKAGCAPCDRQGWSRMDSDKGVSRQSYTEYPRTCMSGCGVHCCDRR